MLRKIFLAVALVGLAVSIYLAYAYVIAHKVACIGGGCEIVAASPYSRIFGIPQPIMGILFYLAVIFSTLHHRAKAFLPFLTAVGAAYSIYLTWVEVSILHAICMWCMISAICTWILFGITLLYEDI